MTGSAPAPRVLFVGLDAFDPETAARLIDAGRLPVLGGLRARSLRARTRNPDGLLVGGSWPTIWSSTSPGRHGFYSFRQVVAGRYEIRRCNPLDVAEPPFWTALDAAGRSVAALDVPLVPPTRLSHGLHVVDVGTHDRQLEPSSAPASLLPELVARHGPYPVVDRCDDYSIDGRWEELSRVLVAGARWRADVCTDLLARRAWDLFATVFSEGHCVGHQAWWLHDESWPGHDPDLARALGDPVAEVYEAVDEALGRILAHAGPATRVAVLMSHGMGPHHDGEHLLAEVLRRLERVSSTRSASVYARELALRRGRRVVRAVQARRHPGDRRFHRVSAVDGSRRFIQVPNNEMFGAIRLNIVGREPRGRVRPGPEADTLLHWLSVELSSLTDPDTGRSLVRRVVRVDDHFAGPRRAWLPDLLVDWERSAPITAAASPTIGIVRGRFQGSRSGDHRPDGELVLSGPTIRPGDLGRVVDSVDVAPTLCAWLDVELEGVDGRAVPEAVDRADASLPASHGAAASSQVDDA